MEKRTRVNNKKYPESAFSIFCLPFRRGTAHSEIGRINGVTFFRESLPIVDSSGKLRGYRMGGVFYTRKALGEVETVLVEREISNRPITILDKQVLNRIGGAEGLRRFLAGS